MYQGYGQKHEILFIKYLNCKNMLSDLGCENSFKFTNTFNRVWLIKAVQIKLKYIYI